VFFIVDTHRAAHEEEVGGISEPGDLVRIVDVDVFEWDVVLLEDCLEISRGLVRYVLEDGDLPVHTGR